MNAKKESLEMMPARFNWRCWNDIVGYRIQYLFAAAAENAWLPVAHRPICM